MDSSLAVQRPTSVVPANVVSRERCLTSASIRANPSRSS